MSIGQAEESLELVAPGPSHGGLADVPGAQAKPQRPSATPVEASERTTSVDVIRGVALLGILAMNIADFAWPADVYSVPTLAPGYGPGDVALWAVNHLVFDTKMMTLFCMLFGAGLVLMSERAEGRGARTLGVYYRRTFWLLMIGLAHHCLIWDGDVLFLYALCGFLLYPFRKLRPKTLIITGVVFNLLIVLVLLVFRTVGVPYMHSRADRVDALVREGGAPGWWDQAVQDGWTEISKAEMPKREEFLAEISKHRGPYLDLVKERASELLWFPLVFVLGGWWLVGGRMLVGMGLMKLGVFSAKLNRVVYARMMAFGYGIGVPLMLVDVFTQLHNNFFLGRGVWPMLDGWPLLTLFGSVPVVFGHIGLVILFCQSNALAWLKIRLAAVGRMALTHYLLTSLICTTLFYGYGFDAFGAIHRPLLCAIVLMIWAFQLWVSPPWLRHFKYGPAEWLWRSLTYWKLQPFRVRSTNQPLASA